MNTATSNEQLAPLGPGFIKGTRRMIRVTKVGSDENTPTVVREDLVGLEVPTIFNHEQLPFVPVGGIGAYIRDVCDVLLRNKKVYATQVLESAPLSNEYYLYIFEEGTFEFID
jgi:hypothetical protein